MFLGSPACRQAGNQEVAGSNPAPATSNLQKTLLRRVFYKLVDLFLEKCKIIRV